MSPSKDDVLGKNDEPAKKKSKITSANDDIAKPKQQSSLMSFFSSSSKTEEMKSHDNSNDDVLKKAASSSKINYKQKNPDNINEKVTDNDTAKAIIPKNVASSATYDSLNDKFVLIRKPRKRSNGNDELPRTSVAAFDLDGTLLKWISDSPGFWPSQLVHYELWNDNVITKMRHMYDEEHSLLVIFTNQGGIQGAHTGKKASLIKSLLDWLESIIQRPLIAIASTKSLKKYREKSYHKPGSNMWKKILVPYFGKKSQPFNVSSSFFVGDSADESDPQGGVDKKFAESVGLAFYEPQEYFGVSNQEIRQRRATVDQQLGGNDGFPITPLTALEARNALMSGYYPLHSQGRPILLILSGVQGSGKSKFSRYVLYGENESQNDERNKSNNNNNWVWLSQDTINNGKPGKREKVFDACRKAILEGKSVIVDRMHLDSAQRQSTIINVVTDEIKDSTNVNVHVVLLNPSKKLITHRVKNRQHHPAKVEGEHGVKLALQSLNQLVVPTYKEEGLDLISCASTEFTSTQLALRYHHAIIDVDNEEGLSNDTFKTMESVLVSSSSGTSSQNSGPESFLSIPRISLGTMKIGRRKCTEVVQKMITGGLFRSIDTAPTYKNEDKIGEALNNIDISSSDYDDVFIIAKVPKRATDSDLCREEFEKTLKNLNRKYVDLLLLHWPSDVIAQNTLIDVWECMESFIKNGKCKALGVCNFNENALAKLLRCCTVPPVVNQVERHPLLPQHALVDFCARNNILIQAHTTLGQGREDILQNPTIVKIANEVKKTPAQVLVQWNLQHGVLVVTKCTQEAHAKEILSTIIESSCLSSDTTKKTKEKGKNLIFLLPTHMKALDGLGNGKRFIAPPFMYGSLAIYCWGERMPLMS